jgi:hypothetical protein
MNSSTAWQLDFYVCGASGIIIASGIIMSE